MEKKTLIAIVTARHRLDTWVQYVRDTWFPLVPKGKADVYFFVGRGEREVKGVVELDCDDSYQGLPEKVRAICRWAKEHEYDFMLKCDDDVVLNPVALLSSGYEKHKYSGRANRPPQPYTVPMGFNYWLSKECIEIVSKAPLSDSGSNDDEKWVAKNLWEHGIELKDDQRYHLHFRPLEPVTKRSLRAIIRPGAFVDPSKPEPVYFSRCIHIGGEQHVKLAEFKKVFNKYGGA